MADPDADRFAERQRAILSRTRLFREALLGWRAEGRTGLPVFQYRQPSCQSCHDPLPASGYFRCELCLEAVQAVILEDQAGRLQQAAALPWLEGPT